MRRSEPQQLPREEIEQQPKQATGTAPIQRIGQPQDATDAILVFSSSKRLLDIVVFVVDGV